MMVAGEAQIRSIVEAFKKARKPVEKKNKIKVNKKYKAVKSHEEKIPTSGQSAPPIKLSIRKLNLKELEVLDALNSGEDRPILTISEIAAMCFRSQSRARGSSWTRNSLRRLVQGGLVEKVEPGKYKVSEKGRRKRSKVA